MSGWRNNQEKWICLGITAFMIAMCVGALICVTILVWGM